jgi:uncharacterized membrane protein YphA (DoxX/SURF4 family)
VGLRTWARVLIALSFLVSGLAETLGATGLVILVSPDARWGPGTHTLALGGLLQMAAAALLASGRKTRWALAILLGYVSLGSVFGNLPQVFDPKVGGSALAVLVANLAVIGGLFYWLHFERALAQRTFEANRLTRSSGDFGLSRPPESILETQPPGGAQLGAGG